MRQSTDKTEAILLQLFTGVKGVYLQRSSPARRQSAAWRVQIKSNGKCYSLTCRGTLKEAEKLYAALAKKLHGEFACSEYLLEAKINEGDVE